MSGGKQFKEEVNKETSTDPIMFGSLHLERKVSVTYLRDNLSELGLEASVTAPVNVREAKVKDNQIQNTVVQLIELHGNRGGTGKIRQNSRGTDIAKCTDAAPPMEAPL